MPLTGWASKSGRKTVDVTMTICVLLVNAWLHSVRVYCECHAALSFLQQNGRNTGAISIRIMIIFLLSETDGKGFCANGSTQHCTEILVSNTDGLFLDCLCPFCFLEQRMSFRKRMTTLIFGIFIRLINEKQYTPSFHLEIIVLVNSPTHHPYFCFKVSWFPALMLLKIIAHDKNVCAYVCVSWSCRQLHMNPLLFWGWVFRSEAHVPKAFPEFPTTLLPYVP